MITFAKAQAASFIASLIDYGLTILCTEVLGFWYMVSTVAGTVSGGLVNFSVSRAWVFNKRKEKQHRQLFRYFLVWSGYLLLTTGGVYAVTHYLKVNYLFSKVGVTLLLAVGYNYPLQKRFVFR